VRAKSKIRDANIPYEVPAREDLAERLDSVLRVVYLVFNEGYSASSGESATRADLSGEAIRLGRLILDLLPEPEVQGLLALMLLHEARRETRHTADGEVILLDDQDRSKWNRALIAEGAALVRASLQSQRFGPYSVQAAIAAVHAESPSSGETDWGEIVGLYDLLQRIAPSPVVELNRSVALAMRDGVEAGLAEVDRLLNDGLLEEYSLAHAARADFLRRLGRGGDARKAYQKAIQLTAQGPARRFLEKRLIEVSG
jgi:RNA polymerase sigma-70 factor (ECF subfamily)